MSNDVTWKKDLNFLNFMKKTIIVAGLLFMAFYVMGQNKTVKVISYNILNGFDYGKDSLREAKVGAWIRSQHPDVVALQELCGFTREKLQHFAAIWGHQYTAILKMEGYPVGLTSDQPIVVEEKLLEGLWHGMLHCRTAGVDFFVVHLSPSDWQFRRKEAEIITGKIEECAAGTDRYIVLGDFNAVSPFDLDYNNKNPYQRERMKKSDSKNEKYKNLINGEYDYSVLSRFLSLSLVDVCRRFADPDNLTTCPTPINVPEWLTAEEMKKTKMRIDYILTSPYLGTKCTNAVIFNDPEHDYLSDHYPVMAIFNL